MTKNNGIQEREVLALRREFPLLRNNTLVYLDNAATTQKPDCVLRAELEFYQEYNANPFRGLYELSEKATECYEKARASVADWLNAKSPEEIVFTRNATEGLNLLAYSLAELLLKPGDEILISVVEHHSNLLPWQQAAKRTGAVLKFLECQPDGTIGLEALSAALTERTKIVSITHMSNVFGRQYDVKAAAALCHSRGEIAVIADGAQSVPHTAVDVQDLDVDFLAFSGHKILGPMGIGALYGKKKYLESMPPFLSGGEMIESVSRTGATFAAVPHKFEAGTVNAAGAVGLAAALDYLRALDFDRVRQREAYLTRLGVEALQAIPHVNLLGAKTPEQHHGILTFTVDDVHPHDVAAILAADGIAVRAGHHCAQPLMQHLGVSSTTRASLSFYNTEEELEILAKSLKTVRRQMGYGE